jgi:hypothetical protein
LFKVGKVVTVTIPSDDEPLEFEIYLRKPTVAQQQEAREKARARQHRRKREFKDTESDAYMSLWEEIEAYEDKAATINALVQFTESDLRTRAYNDTLFDPEYGSDWGEHGETLVSALDAIQQRWDEIERHNDALGDEDADMRVIPGEDPELQELRTEQVKFEDEVQTRLDYLLDQEREKYKGRSLEALRKQLVKKSVDLEGDMAWYQEYRLQMLWNACRDNEDRKQRYFSHPDEVLELPQYVQTQLFNAFDALDRGDPKNLASPLLSSLS